MAGFLNWFKGSKEPEDKKDYNDDTFKAGQTWQYHTRPGEEASTLTILKVERYEREGVVIHVSIHGLKLKNPGHASGLMEEFGHLPLSKDALRHSVTSLMSSGNSLPDAPDGYLIWKEAFDRGEAGVFSISISEAISYAEETINQGTRTGD